MRVRVSVTKAPDVTSATTPHPDRSPAIQTVDEAEVLCAAFGPDGQLVAVGTDVGVEVHEAGTLVRSSPALAMAFSRSIASRTLPCDAAADCSGLPPTSCAAFGAAAG